MFDGTSEIDAHVWSVLSGSIWIDRSKKLDFFFKRIPVSSYVRNVLWDII